MQINEIYVLKKYGIGPYHCKFNVYLKFSYLYKSYYQLTRKSNAYSRFWELYWQKSIENVQD